MTRTAVPLTVPDLSQFARALARSLAEHQASHGEPPSHQTFLNQIARAAGHRNLQTLRVQRPSPSAAPPDMSPPLALSAAARKALTQFDDQGRLMRWPNKYSVQRLAMWVLWMQFDPRRVYSEREVNRVLSAWHTFGDYATLRRELINDRLLTRKADGSEYRKLPARPDADVRALLAAWRARGGAGPVRRRPVTG